MTARPWCLAAVVLTVALHAQETADATIEKIRREGLERSAYQASTTSDVLPGVERTQVAPRPAAR